MNDVSTPTDFPIEGWDDIDWDGEDIDDDTESDEG
jgi:hypothetical protein